MRRLFCSFLLFFVFYSKTYSQMGAPIFKADEFSGFIYSNYTDRQGYTWISTDQGVYRWDTKNLEHFTIADGLPSNEVFKIYQDSKCRVWMAFYNGDLCYYYKGKIYNKKNDKRLRSIPKVSSKSFIELDKVLYFNIRFAFKISQKLPFEKFHLRESTILLATSIDSSLMLLRSLISHQHWGH